MIDKNELLARQELLLKKRDLIQKRENIKLQSLPKQENSGGLVPPPEVRTLKEALFSQAPVADVSKITKDFEPSLDAAISPILATSQVAGMIAEAPALKSFMEGARREESVFAAALSTGIKAIQGKPIEVLEESRDKIFKSAMGTELSTLGNVFKEDLGFDDLGAASAGFLASIFMPSNLISGILSKVSKPRPDTFLSKAKGLKGIQSEIISKFTGIPRESVEVVVSEGPSRVLQKKFSSELIPNEVTRTIQTGINDLVSETGEKVGFIKDNLRLGERQISTNPIKSSFDDLMNTFFRKAKGEVEIPEQAIGTGVLDETGKEITKVIPARKEIQDIDFSKVSGFEDDFKMLNGLVNEKIGKETVSLDELISFREELGHIGYKGYVRGGEKELRAATPKAKSVIRGLRADITEKIHTVSPELKSSDIEHAYAQDLKQRAAKHFDDVSAGERFLRGIDKKGATVAQKKLLKEVVNKITGNDQLLNKIRFNLAQTGFEDLLPSGLGQRVVSGLAAGGGASAIAFGRPDFAAIMGVMAFLTSPKGVAFMLKSGEFATDVMIDLLGAANVARASGITTARKVTEKSIEEIQK